MKQWHFLIVLGTIALAGLHLVAGGNLKKCWNQEVTMTAHFENRAHRSSSVMQVCWSKALVRIPDAPTWRPSILGHAPFIKIPGVGIVFTTLTDGNTGGNLYLARTLAEDPSGFITSESIENAYNSQMLRRDLDGSRLPLMVTYSDTNDRGTVKKAPSEVSVIFTVEKTQQEVTSDFEIMNALPWLTHSLSEMKKMGRGTIQNSDGTILYINKEALVASRKAER